MMEPLLRPGISQDEKLLLMGVLKDRYDLWSQLRECYVKADEMKSQGKAEITVPIDVFLLAKEIPANVERFYTQFLKNVLTNGSKKASE